MAQPVSVPVCYRHPSRETYVRCTRCDRPICPDCMRDAAVGHQCPECVAEGRRSTRPPRTAFGGSVAGRQGYVTLTLIGLNVLMMLLAVVSERGGGLAGGGFGGIAGTVTPLHLWGALVPRPATFTDGIDGPVVASVQGVAGGDYYRLVTSMFLHYGLVHLLLNMWALWVLGRDLEYVLGPFRFIALYLLAGLGGSVAVYYFGEQDGLTAGASGAIFGLFGAIFVVLKRLGRDTSAVVPVLVLNLVFTFAIPGISIAGHLGGLVWGAVVALGLAYAPKERRTAVQVLVCVTVVVALVALTLARTAALT
ncbi:MAG TPA: rhomboid family intramembrane serine protease [Micromonosporaceae bacterium]|nr:rhomboid family intramembrane serine protease [Micromonosporaceae bacterium]